MEKEVKIVNVFDRQWCSCPECGNPKLLMIRPDTILKNFPAYCKKCKQESIVSTKRAKSRVN